MTNIVYFIRIIKIVLFFIFIFSSSTVFSQNNLCIDSTKIDSSRFEINCKKFKFDHPKRRPVCGCDSTTYVSTECAKNHGVTDYISLDGGCNCIDTSLIDSAFILTIGATLKRMRRYQYPIEPVCGCNGKTYLHPNFAVYHDGVTQWTNGPCDCKNEEYIDSSYLDCVKLVQNNRIGYTIHPEQLNYVCGCDSITYPSNCWAMWYAGIFTWYRGKCSCLDTSKINTSITCDSTFQPVCGCDSVTYDNACIAENHFGIINYQEGPCPCYEELLIDTLSRSLNNPPNCRGIGIEFVDPVCGCDSITYQNECWAEAKYGISYYKTGVCRCVETETIDTVFPCDEKYRPICACDSFTYHNACIAEHYYGINKYGHQPGACACYSPMLQDSSFDCLDKSVIDYVCGCDSITYINQCLAIKYGGISSWSEGWCTHTCTDPKLIDTIKFCSTQYDPVCGCDSITYNNECVAFYKNGITSWTKGMCSTNTINQKNNKKDFIIYPNPTDSDLNIQIESRIYAPFYIDLININGELLKSEVYYTLRIPNYFQGFPSGIYFIRLKTSQGSSVSKVVKI